MEKCSLNIIAIFMPYLRIMGENVVKYSLRWFFMVELFYWGNDIILLVIKMRQ